jgi:phage shock protein PspC (stress-responsive transcriptional regulator)
MDKTININLGGTLFQIDEEAFRILRDYLQAINSRFEKVPGGHETIEDIEARIAEIFLSQKGIAGVITRENVDSMISIIGKPEDFDSVEPESAAGVHFSGRKKMYRNTDDTVIGGVCSGIAVYLDTEPVLFRILFVLFAAFFGVGFLVYLALWIALPAARTDSQKRDMYGSAYNKYNPGEKTPGTSLPGQAYNSTSRLGNAINEVFRAIGRVFFIFARIFLIIVGVVFVLIGFLAILSFVTIFIFKFPGFFSIDSPGVNLINFPHFLYYMVNPSAVPWIIILTCIIVILPMLFMIYWGVKMIFWFRARDGVVALTGLVVWVMAIAVLAIISFNEGVSFAQTAKTTQTLSLPNSPDTLFVKSDRRIANLTYDEELSIPHDEYSIYINDEKKELYLRPSLVIDRSEDKTSRVEVRRRSAGRTEMDAMKKAEALIYNFNIKGDTLRFDEYFMLPEGRKWAADDIRINLYIPKGTILKFEKDPKIFIHSSFRNESDEYLESRWESGNSIWKMTDEGLEALPENP